MFQNLQICKFDASQGPILLVLSILILVVHVNDNSRTVHSKLQLRGAIYAWFSNNK